MKMLKINGMVAAVAVLCAAQAMSQDAGDDRMEQAPPGPELVKAAYLGVGTKPVSDTLVQHLDLPDGTGIVVEFVDPGSPAAQTLRKHDILCKLDDQILVNHDQLAVLVRMRRPGDKITLTILRKGKQETVSVELAEKEMPRPRSHPWHMPRIDFGHPDIQRWIPFDQDRVDDMKDRVKEMLDEWGTAPDKIHEMMMKLHGGGATNGSVHLRLKRTATPGTSVNVTTRASTRSVVSTTDARRSFTLTTTNDGKKHLVVSDSSGGVIFDGPVNTEEDTARIPDELKAGFEKVTKITGNIGIRQGAAGDDVL